MILILIFYNKPVAISEDDLDKLEKYINTGDFYEECQDDEEKIEQKKADQEFIKKARKALGENKTVYYDSWD